MANEPTNPMQMDAVRPSAAALDAYVARSFQNLPQQAEVWRAINEGRPQQPVQTANATNGVTNELSRYPGWIQTLILESDMRIHGFNAEGFRSNAQAYGFPQNNLGYFMPSGGAPPLSNSINVPVDGSIPDVRGTIRHEIGHALDEFVRGQGFLSHTSERWRAALEAEISAYRGDVMLGLDRLPSSNDPSFQYKPMHPHDVRSLGYHLSLEAYKPHQYGPEAFAEMFRHYTSLMDVHMGNAAEVDRVLSERYRHAWPVFRDDFIPIMQEKATAIHNERQKQIRFAVADAVDAAEFQGRTMTPEEQRALAAHLETQTTSQIKYIRDQQARIVNIFDDRLNPDLRPEFVHQDGVIQDYVEARRDYDRAVRQEEAFRTRADFDNREFRPTPITAEEHAILRPVIADAERIVAERGRAGLFAESGRIRAAQEKIERNYSSVAPDIQREFMVTPAHASDPAPSAPESPRVAAGPDTELSRAPSVQSAVDAQNALHAANESSRAGRPSGISQAQSDALLDWMVDRTRHAILPREIQPTAQNMREYFANPEQVRGACGLGQGTIGFQAEMLGLETRYHQIADVTPADASQRHAFSTVAVPIQQADGQVVTKQYLVDTTFRQFMTQGGEVPSWGEALSQTPQGREIAGQLLRNGYVELTPQVAELYIGSQRRDPATRAQVRGDVQPWMERLATSTMHNDYSLQEMIEYRKDIRTPSLVASNAPAESIIAQHPDGEMAGYPKIEAEIIARRNPQAMQPYAAADTRVATADRRAPDSPMLTMSAPSEPLVAELPRAIPVEMSSEQREAARAEAAADKLFGRAGTKLPPEALRIQRLMEQASRGSIVPATSDTVHAPEAVTGRTRGADPVDPRDFGRKGLSPASLPAGADGAGAAHTTPVVPQSFTPSNGNGGPTASLVVPAADASGPISQLGQAAVTQLRQTTPLRPEQAQSATDSRNATVDRVVSRAPVNALPVAANDRATVPFAPDTRAHTALATPANDGGPAPIAQPATAPDSAAPAPSADAPAQQANGNGFSNSALGGVALAMATEQVKSIVERQSRGDSVATEEYVAAALNIGSATMDMAGKGLDTLAQSGLGKLAPRLERAGGPMVQAILAAPMIIAAARTGDTTQIGAATFGAIGGVSAGLAGQALIPIPGVGFVIGVVAADGAAKVGGLATTAMFNDDPAKRANATRELQQIGVDYFASPGAALNLPGAVASSVGRAATALGEVADWGGAALDGMAVSAQGTMSKSLSRIMPPVAADAISGIVAAPTRIAANTLRAAGMVVSAAGTVVDGVGQAAEDVGHHVNKGITRFQQTLTQEFHRDPTVRGAARAVVAATADVAEHAVAYAGRRIHQGIEAASNAVAGAQSWVASHVPSWLGGNSDQPAKPATHPAPRAAAPAAQNWQQQQYTLNGVGHGTARAAANHMRDHGVTVDVNHDGKITQQEFNAARAQWNRTHAAGNGR